MLFATIINFRIEIQTLQR